MIPLNTSQIIVALAFSILSLTISVAETESDVQKFRPVGWRLYKPEIHFLQGLNETKTSTRDKSQEATLYVAFRILSASCKESIRIETKAGLILDEMFSRDIHLEAQFDEQLPRFPLTAQHTAESGKRAISISGGLSTSELSKHKSLTVFLPDGRRLTFLLRDAERAIHQTREKCIEYCEKTFTDGWCKGVVDAKEITGSPEGLMGF